MTRVLSVVKADEAVQRDVETELRWDPRLQPNQIAAVVGDGVVTLTGQVDSLVKKWTAEDAVQRLRGVRAVANTIEVRLPAFAERDDTDIARAAAQALAWDSSVPDDEIRIAVAQGMVTLSGEVEWQFQRQAAAEVVSHLLGVRGVDNRISLRPAVSVPGLKAKIDAALVRGAIHDAHKIEVEVTGSRVVLRGTVRSWAERRQAAATAWSAAGVSALDNRIEVAL